jgi:hypothetical protein
MAGVTTTTRACAACNTERDPNDFSARKRECKYCVCERERKRRAAKSDLKKMYDRLLWARCRHKMPGFVEFDDLQVLWDKCKGLSVISGKPAKSFIIIDLRAAFDITNIAPVTKIECMSLANRRRWSEDKRCSFHNVNEYFK